MIGGSKAGSTEPPRETDLAGEAVCGATGLGTSVPCHQLGLKHDHDEQESAADDRLPVGGERNPAETVFEVQDDGPRSQVNGESWMDAAMDRLKGYKQALASADIAFDETLVRDGDWLPLRGYEAGLDLLSMPNPPTAIFCGNDLMAIGVMEAAQEKGLRVPADLSVMGYDDRELARYTHPPLSTLVLPNYEMGQRAAEILIDMAIHGKHMRPMTIKVDGPLVVRETTSGWPARAAQAKR
ncbi:HTH-type transcriptional repressor PurR [compost metagenome]